jgi:hypothetical protein
MGMFTALDIIDTVEDIYSQVGLHLRANLYPAAPAEMVEPCVNAIDLVAIGDYDGEVTLPEGTTWRGQTWAPASALVENFRLDAWIQEGY